VEPVLKFTTAPWIAVSKVSSAVAKKEQRTAKVFMGMSNQRWLTSLKKQWNPFSFEMKYPKIADSYVGNCTIPGLPPRCFVDFSSIPWYRLTALSGTACKILIPISNLPDYRGVKKNGICEHSYY
jgi:hypothetical protein